MVTTCMLSLYLPITVIIFILINHEIKLTSLSSKSIQRFWFWLRKRSLSLFRLCWPPAHLSPSTSFQLFISRSGRRELEWVEELTALALGAPFIDWWDWSAVLFSFHSTKFSSSQPTINSLIIWFLCWLLFLFVFPLAEPLAVPPPITAAGSESKEGNQHLQRSIQSISLIDKPLAAAQRPSILLISSIFSFSKRRIEKKSMNWMAGRVKSHLIS